MKFNLILVGALVAGVLSASAATNTPATADIKSLFGDPAVAKGKNFEIKQSELDQVLSGAKANAATQGQPLPPEFSIAILNQLITIHALLQKSTDADRATGNVEAGIQYSNMVKRFGSEEALLRQLKAIDVTPEDLRTKAAQEATAKATLRRELNINVTDEDAKAFFEKHQADFEQPELARAQHILLMTIDPATRNPLSTNTIAAKKLEIENILKEVQAGTNFSLLATKYSEDPGSKENGGELPQFPRGQMVPEFEVAAFALTNNQISGIVTSPFGYHIIKMIEKTPAKKYSLNDKIPQIGKTVAEICKAEVETQKVKDLAPDYVKKLRKDLNVEIVDPGLKSLDDALRARAESEASAAPTPAPAPAPAK